LRADVSSCARLTAKPQTIGRPCCPRVSTAPGTL
jgi:hypothetical protein